MKWRISVPRSPAAGGEIFADLPVHRRLECVLDRERAAFDEEHPLERRHPDDAPEGFDKARVAFRVNIRVRDLDLGRGEQIGFHFRLIEVRMIKPDRIRAEKTVEIDQAMIMRRVVKIGALALLEIDHDAKTVEQDMLGDLIEDAGFRSGFQCLALTGAAWRRSAGRLREHGWHTHAQRVAARRRVVNQTNEMAGSRWEARTAF